MEQKRHSDVYKIMTASPNTSLRSEIQTERPLALNAWTQTVDEDFQTLWECNKSEQFMKREQELLEKISYLEDSLLQHADILAQIHATAARRDSLHIQPASPACYQGNQGITTVINQNQQYQSQPQQQQHQQQVQLQRHQQQSASRNTSPTQASVINNVQSFTEQHKDSIKYTIVTERHPNVVEGPIEIELADEESALLNNSDDSGRLEICLSDETNEIKDEATANAGIVLKHTETNKKLSIKETPHIKQRKLSYSENGQQQAHHHHEQTALYQHEPQKVASPAVNYYNDDAQTLPRKFERKIKKMRQSCTAKRNRNNLMKSAKVEQTFNDGDSQQQLNNLDCKFESNISNCKLELNNSNCKFDMDNVMMSIGPNNTRISAKLYENMNWSSASIATRKLLMAIFGRQTLATHSMTGKPSPAFKDFGKPLKQMLNPYIIQDIIFAVTRKCNVSEKEVRNAITTKCADENKMMKLQESKQRLLKEIVHNKENICS